MNIPDNPEATGAESARLAEAFQIFNRASEDLAAAYTHLQGQVAALTERMALLQEALPAGVIVLDAGGIILEANAAARRLLWNDPEGQAWNEVEGGWSATETPGEIVKGERRLAVTVTPLDSAGGRIVLLHDVTETHRLRAQAERHQRLAAMGEMAAQLAHQLRTPLAAALLYVGNLENPELAADARVGIARKAVGRLKHLERLIQDTLLFARGEILGRETFAVADLLADLVHTFEPLARQRGATLRIEDNGAGAILTGNRKALVGALANLLENGLQAADGAGIIVVGAARSGDRLLLTVSDNGRGMAPEVVSRLFEPFFTTRADGTGLGLAIARGVARAHGGGIDVRSAPGAGTEFVITLPLAESKP